MQEQIPLKWRTTTEYIDITTGEIITESQYYREKYYIVKRKKLTPEINENTRTGLRRYQCECKRIGQYELFTDEF